MKKIINGKIYDTDKAEKVLSFNRRVTATSFFGGEYETWVSSEIYKTKKGTWFEIVGVETQNPQWNPLTEERAKEVLAVCPDTYQEYFGELEEA